MKALSMEHSADMRSGESHNSRDAIDELVTARSGPSSSATGRIASVPAHRKKASRSNAKHVRQERVDRGNSIAGRSNTSRLRPENRCRDLGVEGRQAKPAGRRMPRRCRTACHEDRAIVVEIDGVSIMIWRWLVDRGAAGEMIGCLIVMGVAMASLNATVIVMMAVCMAVAMIMTSYMDMRPIGMPRSLGK